MVKLILINHVLFKNENLKGKFFIPNLLATDLSHTLAGPTSAYLY